MLTGLSLALRQGDVQVLAGTPVTACERCISMYKIIA